MRAHPNDWRWRPALHRQEAARTITVYEPSDEQKAEREKKIEDGAKVVPFGFARALEDA